MSTRIFYLLCSFILLCASWQLQPLSAAAREQTHEEWLRERIVEAKSIKVGMSRAELLKVFDKEAGLNTNPATHYILRGCPYIKLYVEFESEPGINIRGVSDERLKLKTISEPSLGYLVYD